MNDFDRKDLFSYYRYCSNYIFRRYQNLNSIYDINILNFKILNCLRKSYIYKSSKGNKS